MMFDGVYVDRTIIQNFFVLVLIFLIFFAHGPWKKM
jgi:hypothetical protein